jgi:hypothetical protein
VSDVPSSFFDIIVINSHQLGILVVTNTYFSDIILNERLHVLAMGKLVTQYTFQGSWRIAMA